MMVRRFLSLFFSFVAASLLSGCLTTSEVQQRPGVAAARACMRALNTDPEAIPGFVVHACTNDGVWMVDQVDPVAGTVAQYDFVNGEYAGPETGYGFVPIDSLGEVTIQAYQSLHKTLNQSLLDPPGKGA